MTDDIQSRLATLERRVEVLEGARQRQQQFKEIKVKTSTSTSIDVNRKQVVLSGKRLNAGDVIHVKKQQDPAENGYYQVQPDFLLTRLDG